MRLSQCLRDGHTIDRNNRQNLRHIVKKNLKVQVLRRCCVEYPPELLLAWLHIEQCCRVGRILDGNEVEADVIVWLEGICISSERARKDICAENKELLW